VKRLLVVSALVAFGAGGCADHEQLAREALAPGALPHGWEIDRRNNDLVYEANGFRFPVAVAGSLRAERPERGEPGGVQVVSIQSEHGMLRIPVSRLVITDLTSWQVSYRSPDARFASIVAFRPIALGEPADFVPRETAALVAGFLRATPEARVERVASSPLPFGERATRGCRADLRWKAEGRELSMLVLSAAGLGHVAVVSTAYDPSPSQHGDPHTEAWQRSTALLRIFEPPPAELAKLSQEQRTPPALAGTCAAPAS
jgi:hypothetical protein